MDTPKFGINDEIYKTLHGEEGSPLDEKIKSFLNGIEEKKEEILKAFIAKHGYEPDECEIVIQGCSWFVRKRHPDEFRRVVK